MVAKNPFGAPTEAEWEFNFEGVEDGFPTIPTGTYYAIVADVTMEPSKKGDYNNVVWVFEISAGEQAGMTIKRWNTTNPANLGFLKQTLGAIGITGDTVKFKRSDVIGRSCMLFIEKGEYQGKPSSNVKNVAPLPEDAKQDATPKRKGTP